MAKAEKDALESYVMTVEQVFEKTANRDIIPCTLASDIGLGGGIPLGASVVLGGKPKLGKTTFALQCAANAQKLFDAEVFIFPIEGRLTHLTLQQVRGFDRSKAKVIMPPPVLDDDGEIISYRKWHAQQWWDAIGETIAMNRRAILIIDSLSALSSEKEQSEGMGYQGRGDTQKLEAQFCRSYGDLIVPNEITVFFITQVQANTSGYGPALQIKAGNAVKHQADVIMFGKWAEKWKEENGKVLGHDMHYTVECSALGAPCEIAIPLRYGYGIDNIKDVITQAVTWDIIRKEGAWFTTPFIEREEGIELVDLDTLDKKEKPVKMQGEPATWRWFANPAHTKQLEIIESIIREKVFGTSNDNSTKETKDQKRKEKGNKKDN